LSKEAVEATDSRVSSTSNTNYLTNCREIVVAVLLSFYLNDVVSHTRKYYFSVDRELLA